ncbi:uncharacterized protein LOC130982274 [Arachis stenosperma]|uniref:uncharacterized protein LOC130982274 n=1 Tax=Arachis stenosperma TaxID=217475 RepID=UPI0025ABC364|nr:uncharacterized protein LOC130982274 [Arachis stenosperma]
MSANRRSPGQSSLSSEPAFDPTTLLESMNAMAAAVHDSIAATNRAVERMERQQGKDNGNSHGNGNGLGNSVPEGDRLMTLASFLKVNRHNFSGTINPTGADDWFHAMERALQVQHVPRGQQVEFATYMLKGDAQHWWQEVSQLLGQGGVDITWVDFHTEFYKKYFPPSARTANGLELL